MSNTRRPASRPSLTPVHTRKTTGKTDSMMNVGVKVTIDGQDYTVRAGDLTAWDTRELRKQVGYSFNGLLTAFGEDPDIDLIAALVWLSRRIDGDRLTDYETVANELGYDVFDTLTIGEAGAEEDDGNPEG